METKFETFASATFEGIAITRDGILLEINDQFAAMLGYSHDETLNRPVLDFVAPESRDLVRQRISSRTEGVYRHLSLRKDGSTFPVEVQSRSIIFHGKSARATVIRDITDRVANESALKISEQKYRDIISWAPIGIFRSSIDGKLLMANRALANLLGFDSEEQMLGLHSGQNFYDNPADRDKLVARFDTNHPGAILEAEVQWKRKDGSRIWVSLTGHTAIDPESGERYYEGFVFDITLSRTARETLRESEERFRTFIEDAPLAIDISREGTTIYSNKKCLEMFGFTDLDHVKATPISDRWAPHDRPAVLERIRDRHAGKAVPAEYEGTGLRQDGTTFPVSVSVSLVHLPDGPASIAVLVDNTEQKLAQESLRLRSAALEAAANAILITDTAGAIEWVNPAFSSVSGYSFDEAIGKNPRDLIKSGKQDRAFYEEQWKTILAGNVWEGHLTNKRKDGSLYEEEMTITPVRGQDGNIRHFIAIKQDVTEQMKRQEELRESEERFRSALYFSPIGMALVSVDGKWLDANPALCAIVGYTREELLASDFQSITHPDDLAPDLEGVRRILAHEIDSYGMEKRYIHKSGRHVWIQLNVSLLWNADGTPRYFISQVQDITNRRKADEESSHKRGTLPLALRPYAGRHLPEHARWKVRRRQRGLRPNVRL